MTTGSLYNQTAPDDVFIAGFVARQATLDALLRRLHAAQPGEDIHQIFIGPRGMGKTSLLRRIAIAIMRDETLAARYVPLTFREEQYNVLRLGDFWRNCGEALAEWAEANGRGDLAQRLDAELLTPPWDDTHAGDRFRIEMDALDRRAVLLVDNLDLILNQIANEGNWTLRRYLLAQDGPALIGAATQPLVQSADRDEAFYQFFQPEYLIPLNARETEMCMRALAIANGAEGDRVLATLDHQPERLRTLHTLTGGNPRVLALVYRLLATHETGAAMADLEVLLDQVTPYFKARVEEYTSAHQRAVIDAIALHWDPITLAQLAPATNIAPSTLSGTLKKLRDENLIETVASSGSYTAHQMIERFFNIWYLMRHGTRRTKQKMRWLVEFLTSFYSSDELNDIARRAQLKGTDKSWRPEYAVAFDEALARCDAQKQADDGDSNVDAIVNGLLRKASAARETGDLEATLKFHDQAINHCYTQGKRSRIPFLLFNRAMNLRRHGRLEDALADYEQIMSLIEPARHASGRRLIARTLLNKSGIMGILHEPAKEAALLAMLLERFDRDVDLQDIIIKAMVNQAIQSGQMGDRAAARVKYETIVVRFQESNDPKIVRYVTQALYGRAMMLFAEESWSAAIIAFDKVLERDLDNVPNQSMDYKSNPLIFQAEAFNALDMLNEALTKLDAAIALLEAHNDPLDWRRLGAALYNRAVLFHRMGDIAAAEANYTRLLAICIEPDTLILQDIVAETLMSLAKIADERQDRVSEMAYYDDLLVRFEDSNVDILQPHIAHAMLFRGIVLDEKLDKAPVIAAYEAVVARFSTATDSIVQEALSGAMMNLPIALDEAGRGDDALVAFDALIARFGDDPNPALRANAAQGLVNKAISYSRAGDKVQEHAAYHQVLRRYGGELSADFNNPLVMSAFFLADELEKKGDWAEAIDLYERALARPTVEADATSDMVTENINIVRIRLANLLIDVATNRDRAEKLLETIEVDDPIIGRSNRAWLALLHDDVEQATMLVQDVSEWPVPMSALLRSAIELARGNFGLAIDHARLGLDAPDREGRFHFGDDHLRLLRVAVQSGFGEKLLHWFEETTLSERLAPLYVAFRAIIFGEATLHDVSPEIAEPATIIFQRLVRGRSVATLQDQLPTLRRGSPRRSPRNA